jgi:hypothetical protein
VKLSLLSGRSPQVKKQLSESLLAALQDLGEWPADVAGSVSVRWSTWTAIPTAKSSVADADPDPHTPSPPVREPDIGAVLIDWFHSTAYRE